MRCVALMVLLAAGYVAGATELESRTCEDDRVCVLAMASDDDRVDFRARNLSDFPVTLRLRVWPDNLVSDDGNRRLATLEAGEERLLLQYRPRREGRATWYRYRFRSNYGRHDVRHDDDYLYRPPYEGGKRYRILQGFGSRFSHTGNETYAVDFDMPVGSPVHAARGGVVVHKVEEHGEGCWASRCAPKANFVVVLHDDGSTGEYYHLVRDGVLVEPGERVERGQHIARSGNSGHSTMPHLHFGVYDVDDEGRTRSLPIRFETRDGIESHPRPGRGFFPR